MSVINIIQIAKTAHQVNKAYCESIGDHSQPNWEKAPQWQKESAIEGVKAHLNSNLTPEQSHENWMKLKLSEGWIYGPEKDPEKKIHPCIKPYADLPKEQQVKDSLFKAVIESFK